jgi:maltose-binding protein MalE
MTKAVYPNASNPVCTSFEPRFPEYLQTRDHLGAAISSVLAGSDEPKAALDKAAQQIRAVLENAGYYNASS